MKRVDGRCKINGLLVAEVDIAHMPGKPLTMDAKYALGVAQALPTGAVTLQETHGQCSAYTNNWSERTMELLTQLLDSMERDLLPRHFDVGALEEANAGIVTRTDEEPGQV